MLEWEVVQETTGYWEAPNELPVFMRPQHSLYFPSVTTNGSYVIDHTAFAWVGSNGVVGFQVGAQVNGALNCGTACWVVQFPFG